MLTVLCVGEGEVEGGSDEGGEKWRTEDGEWMRDEGRRAKGERWRMGRRATYGGG